MRDRKNDHHRKAAEVKVGRKLGKDEIVHHANEDKTDNSPANISVKSRASHTADHNKSRGLSKLRAALRMHKEGKKIY